MHYVERQAQRLSVTCDEAEQNFSCAEASCIPMTTDIDCFGFVSSSARSQCSGFESHPNVSFAACSCVTRPGFKSLPFLTVFHPSVTAGPSPSFYFLRGGKCFLLFNKGTYSCSFKIFSTIAISCAVL